jgi:hypothetical protein
LLFTNSMCMLLAKNFHFFQILNSNFFGSLATLFTSTWLNVGPFCIAIFR